MELRGKTALIAGGGSGLGAATARMLVDAGATAGLVDIDDEKGEALARELGSAAHYSRADVTDPQQVERAVAGIVERFSKIDIVLNCAGIGGSNRVLGREGPVDLEWFTKIVHVNLIGTFNVIRLAAAAMAKNQAGAEGERGVIINTASVAAFEGQIGQAGYSASKGGIVGMTLPIAREFARHGIRVVTIAPGLFDTPLLAGLPGDVRESLGESVPYPRRLGQPDEFAQLARHIIENLYLNGTVIRLDAAIRMAPS